MDKKKVWTKDDLQVLNTIAQPVWIYSCSTQKILWANKSSLVYFNRTLEQLSTFKFTRLSPEEQNSLSVLNTLVWDEVETGGTEQILSGFGHSILPGVVPHDFLSSSEFLYKQIPVSWQRQEVCLHTQIQLVRSPSLLVPAPRLCAVKVAGRHKDRVSTDGRMANGKTAINSTCKVAHLLELVEDIKHGREIDLDVVDSIHQSLIRGEFVSQPTRLEEELVSKEELDDDVGLNLLQLLGSRNIGSNFIIGPELDTDVAVVSGNSGRQPEESEDEKEVVGASLVPAMEAVLATVEDWRFDAFKLAEVTQGHPLSALGFWLMKRYDIIRNFQLDATTLALFLRKVEDGYPENPYHNKTHAADVLQGMHVMLTRGGLHRRLGEELAMLAGYLAAIVHDYEHKGLNNDFLVRVGDDLALTYNDISPMENHHVAAVFKLVRIQEYNFLKKMPKEKLARLRRLLIDMVLATDMKQHFNILSKFQAKLQVKLRSSHLSPVVSHTEISSHQEDPLPISDDDADKSLIMQAALKCADVGHLSAPWEVHHRWVSGLEEEFFRQGDREKTMHLMVSPLMDRCRDGITKSQVGFFDIVALPLFWSWATVFSDALPLVRAVEDNCNRWRALEAGRSTK